MDITDKLPLISIIVPVYNVKDYLEKCLSSICLQTYKNLEIIVVDDGSTDGSEKICDSFAQKDTRIKVVHQINGGQSNARNKGLSIAAGEYIGFVDSDDWIAPDMYEFLYLLLKNNQADIAVCAHIVEMEAETNVRYSTGKLTVFSGNEALRALIDDKRVRNYVWDKLYKRQLFEGILFPKNQIYEDMVVTPRIIHKAHRVVMQDYPKYHYLKREGSTTLAKQYEPQKDYLWFLRVYEQVKFVYDNGIWNNSPRYVHKCGMRLIGKLIMLPSSPLIEDIIVNVFSKMREFTNVRWPQVSIAFMFKRFLAYRYFTLYKTLWGLNEKV